MTDALVMPGAWNSEWENHYSVVNESGEIDISYDLSFNVWCFCWGCRKLGQEVAICSCCSCFSIHGCNIIRIIHNGSSFMTE